MNHGDPENPKKNPRPVKLYEVIATTDAPGPWDAVQGYLDYQVNNPECTPEDTLLGVHKLPRVVGHDFVMTRVDEKTWKGYFYRDFIQDEDYYGLGVCHWDASSVSTAFIVHGETFGAGSILKDFLHNGPQTEYFKKSEYWDHALTGDQALVSTAATPEVIQHSDAFFPITVSVKEATP
jgi:hypothetical protein